MALDRQSIMRTDFPSNRRGYDPAAVDAHLDRIADEVEELRRQAAVPAPLSAQAGEQVKAIVEAAERGAQEIRDAAQAEAREHVARVTAAADRLRERIEQMERDMTQLVVDLRTGAERLRGDLDGLQARRATALRGGAPRARPRRSRPRARARPRAAARPRPPPTRAEERRQRRGAHRRARHGPVGHAARGAPTSTSPRTTTCPTARRCSTRSTPPPAGSASARFAASASRSARDAGANP